MCSIVGSRASAVEAFAQPAHSGLWLESDELDELLVLNEHWIHLKDKNTVLRIEEYVDLHDEALRPWIRSALESLDIRIIRQSEFLQQFYSCVRELIAYVNEQKLQTLYVMGGQSFGKSNIWLILLFWEFARGKIGADVKLVSETSYFRMLDAATESFTILFLDDCMYSGMQILMNVDDGLDTIIMCPYISKSAHRLIRSSVESGKKIKVITRLTPSSTLDSIMYMVANKDGVEKELLYALDVFAENDKVTWIFDHKIADMLSVPQPLFANTPTLRFTGNIVIVDPRNPAQRNHVLVKSFPKELNFPLLDPCHVSEYYEREPCYGAEYKKFGYSVTAQLKDRILQVFVKVHDDARLEQEDEEKVGSKRSRNKAKSIASKRTRDTK